VLVHHQLQGTSSSDPDNDIASWSLDFGDGASASGSWSTNPPTEVTHAYLPGQYAVTLTVTDSAGRSDSDAMLMAFVDQTPD
jgi:PKD repeat protein